MFMSLNSEFQLPMFCTYIHRSTKKRKELLYTNPFKCNNIPILFIIVAVINRIYRVLLSICVCVCLAVCLSACLCVNLPACLSA